jgi:hypothetical protein
MVKTGERLRSQVCSTEVIVVHPGPDTLELTCGGHPMIPMTAEPAPALSLIPELSNGTILGKRYTDTDATSEILVTKSGAGTLADGDNPLVIKSTKSLPSSD